MLRASALLCLLTAGILALPPPARAQAFDNTTYLTFSGAVRVPGATLAAGKYRFRLADESTGRKVMQVMTYNDSQAIAMFHTLPDYRVRVTDETSVIFKEAPAGVPPAIQTLFFAGEHLGYAFLYPKEEPAPVVATPPVVAEAAAPVARVEEPVPPLAEAAPAPMTPMPPAAAPTAAPAAPLAAEPLTGAETVVPGPELPATATPLPLEVLGGVSALILGLGVRRFRAR